MPLIDLIISDTEDLACHTGATYILDIQIIDDCSNMPDDLTGYTAVMRVFDADETDEIIEVDGVISEPHKGLIHFEIDADDTDDLGLGMYSHQIDIESADQIIRIGFGKFEVAE